MGRSRPEMRRDVFGNTISNVCLRRTLRSQKKGEKKKGKGKTIEGSM